jgi:hypothetical protein
MTNDGESQKSKTFWSQRFTYSAASFSHKTRLNKLTKTIEKEKKRGKKNLYSSIHKSACFHIFSQTLDCIIALL